MDLVIGLLIIVCGVVASLLFMLFRQKTIYKNQLTHFSSEIHHLTQSLRETEHHRDILISQTQQKDQRIENLQSLVTDVSCDNSSKTAELEFLKGIKEKHHQQHEKIEVLLSENSYLKATLEQEKQQTEEKVRLLKEAEKQLSDQFKALSSEILSANNQTFLELANEKFKVSMENSQTKMMASLVQKEESIQTMINPIQQALCQVDTKIHALEKERVGAYENLKTQVHHLISSQKELKLETSNLVKALRTPQVRGQWGEMQLKRVVEIAGLVNHCDFVEQSSTTTENGKVLRPDMIIHLPGGGKMVVDAKAPLMAYLEALDASSDEEREVKLQEHARHVRNHIRSLSQKAYWEQFSPAPDFVVLFLPGEMFFSAALEQDPELLESGFRDKVILATPTTLVALLRAVSYGWRQESITENAKNISALGKELAKRIADMGDHVLKLGKSIGNVVDHYNQTVGTLERRVLVTARKFKELDPHAQEIDTVTPITLIPREVQAIEFVNTHENSTLISESHDILKGDNTDDPFAIAS